VSAHLKPSRSRHELLCAEPDDESSAEPEFVRAMIQPVRDFRQKAIGLNGEDKDMPGRIELDAAPRCHRKIVRSAVIGSAVGLCERLRTGCASQGAYWVNTKSREAFAWQGAQVLSAASVPGFPSLSK
jgi:hypothetical protein